MKTIKRKQVLERVRTHLMMGAIVFIVFVVIEKLVLRIDDWPWIAVVLVPAYILGEFIKPFIMDKNDKLIKKIVMSVGTSIIAFFLVAFIAGILINYNDWLYASCWFVIEFNVGLIFGDYEKELEEARGNVDCDVDYGYEEKEDTCSINVEQL